MMDMPSTVLPQPVSPISPNRSLSFICRSTVFTALTRPSGEEKWALRSIMSSITI